jgi:hypothetical protein
MTDDLRAEYLSPSVSNESAASTMGCEGYEAAGMSKFTFIVSRRDDIVFSGFAAPPGEDGQHAPL